MNSSVKDRYTAALHSKMNEHLQLHLYSDFEFEVEGKPFKIHRLVLGAASEYFHVLFTEISEKSKVSVVMLEDVTADTFEAVLKFIYTGEVSITFANLYEMFYASDCYKLPHLKEACIPYIEEYTSQLVNNVMQLYQFFRATCEKDVIKILDKCIFDHFGDFSQTPEFLQISIDDLSRILKRLGNSSASNHDIFHKAIIRWTNHKVSQSPPEEKRQYSEKLLKNIDFRKLSAQYLAYITKWHIEHSNAPSTSSSEVDDVTHFEDDEKPAVEPRVHAFVNNYRENSPPSELFSCFDEYKRRYKWIHSYSFKHRLPDFMRTVKLVNNDYLYCLSYAKNTTGEQNTNKLIATSSVSLCPNWLLTSPPVILENFEMCKMQECIYVYNKNAWSNVACYDEKSAPFFDEDELSRAIYLYNAEVNVWLPVPPLRQKYANACMTCDDQRIYLIGGTDSNKFVQSYDHRTSEWMKLEPTSGIFERAACCFCSNDSKLYVSGGCHNPKKVETYDSTAARWSEESDMREGLCDHELLVDELGYCITYNKYLKPKSPENVFAINFEWATSIYDDVRKSSLIKLYEAEVIHMTLFKPYGF